MINRKRGEKKNKWHARARGAAREEGERKRPRWMKRSDVIDEQSIGGAACFAGEMN